jgi:RHS repeat-associated protein
MTVSGATTRYALDVAGGLPEVIAATGGATTHYLQVQGQVLAQYDSGTWGYVAPDALGSVRQVVDPAGSVTLVQSYDPFGDPLTSSGSASSVFGYTGEQVDASTGLVYLRARYYQSGTGQFLSRDPFPGFTQRPATLHPYAYVTGNPVNQVDPSGYNGDPGTAQIVIACLFDNPACRAFVVQAAAIGASITAAGPYIIVVGGAATLIVIAAKYNIPVEPLVAPEPAPEARNYYQPPSAPAPDVTRAPDRSLDPPIPQAPPAPCYWSADGCGGPVSAIRRAPQREPKPEQVTDEKVAKARKLNDMARARGQTLAQMAVAWVLRHPGMTSALVGASSVRQVEDNVAALNNLAFSAEELKAIEGILAK